MLKTFEASKVLGCHPETLRRLSKANKIKCFRDINNHRVFERSELLEFKKLRDSLKKD